MNTSAAKTFWKRGEPMVWLSGASLTLILAIMVTLIAVVVLNAMGIFWPHTVEVLSLTSNENQMGERIKSEHSDTLPKKLRTQFKIGNRDLNRLDFQWINDEDILEITTPEDATVLERMEHGNFYGFIESIQSGSVAIDENESNITKLRQLQKGMEPKRKALKEISEKISKLNHRTSRTDRKIKKLRYYDAVGNAEKIAEMEATLEAFNVRFSELVEEQSAAQKDLTPYQITVRDVKGRTKSVPVTEIVRAYQPNKMGTGDKASFYVAKIWELLSAEPRESNTEGGLLPAIFGTVMLVFLMSMLSFPMGVIAGIYLREYAKDGAVVRLVRIAVNNLAGVPSIVYGVFGLGFFVYGVGGFIDQIFFPELLPTPTFGTGGILWAALTLGLLTVPVVIVSTEEAFGAIPRGVREASMALGATKFQTLYKVLIPMASPGILTGFILAMARAAGEVAPLMITGVVKLAPSLPLDGNAPFLHLERKFMHLGFHIYDIGFQSPNVEAAKPMVFVTALLLVLIVLALSSTAIIMRERMKRKYSIKSL